MMHGFCSNDALYSASLSITMFIFLLIHETVIISNQIWAYKNKKEYNGVLFLDMKK